MKEESDPIKQIEQFKRKIIEKGIVHHALLEYLGFSAVDTIPKTTEMEESNEVYQILKESQILTNKCEFKEFLETVSHLWEKHQFKKGLKYKIECLLIILKNEITSIFSEKEIFDVFRLNRNSLILLILYEQKLLSVGTITNSIDYTRNKDQRIVKFLYPEIRKDNEEYFNKLLIKDKKTGLKETVEENDQNLDLFYIIRKEGKKEPKIIELIREDKIEEFISFVEHSPINLNDKIQIEDALFDTDFKKITPIEYSVLFGSIKIFKYLYMKEVNIKFNDIFEYAIQGRNYEIIHLLEERKEIIEELNNPENQLKYLELSIQMHHNEIFDYFLFNYLNQITEEIINIIIIYRNYQIFDQLIKRNQVDFNNKEIITNIFCSFCKNGNEEIVKILVNHPNIDINSKDNIFDHSL